MCLDNMFGIVFGRMESKTSMKYIMSGIGLSLLFLVCAFALVGCGGSTDQTDAIFSVEAGGDGYTGPYSITTGPSAGTTGKILVSPPDKNGDIVTTLLDPAGNLIATIDGFISPGSGGKVYFSADENGYQINGGGNAGDGLLSGAGTMTLPDGSTGGFTLSPTSP
jgi:hypothetical protein